MPTFDVVVYGLFCADAVVKPVERLPVPGRLEFAEVIELHTGGCSLNTGLALHKLGARVGIGGKVGDDNFGLFLLSKIRELGASTALVRVTKKAPTSATIVMLNTHGERSFVHVRGANATFSPADFDWKRIRGAKWLHIAGTLLMPGFDGAPLAGVLRKARKLGIKTCVDTVYDATGQWMKLIAPCLPHMDVFMPSYEEARAIAGKEEPADIAEVFLRRGVPAAVIKLGEKGCYIRTKERETRLPAVPVARVVDTTGAGDSFAAGFVYGLAQGWSLDRCGMFANAVGACCVQAVGATTGIKSLSETRKIVRKSYAGA